MGGLIRVLAIEPTRHGFQFAVLESGERLVEWGGRRVSGEVSVFLGKLSELMHRYRPDVLALEEPAGSSKGPRIVEALAWAEQLFADHELARCVLTDRKLWAHFSRRRASRQEIAALVAPLFPELGEPPAPRRPWETESQRVSLFMAVARGVAAASAMEPDEL